MREGDEGMNESGWLNVSIWDDLIAPFFDLFSLLFAILDLVEQVCCLKKIMELDSVFINDIRNAFHNPFDFCDLAYFQMK